ncbi:MAG TPA: MFS transporter [Solirubrobacteraceae bacterium]|nr:MFS transporter [Solirubrobacteraceae bacterium]
MAALIHFDVSCMVWTILGALGISISQSLHLSAGTMGIVVGTPLVAAAVARVAMGILADRFGPRRVGSISLVMSVAPLIWGWLAASSVAQLLGVGVLLGVAGGSFAVAIPLASRWYPAGSQGVAMGIAGAGNAGTVVCTLVAPRLAQHLGWHAALGIATVPIVLGWVAFTLLAKEPPAPAQRLSARGLAAVLGERDVWKLCAFYCVTFGCFVGFASFLPILLHGSYGLSKLQAATVTAVGVGLGSLLRPLGGWLADRFGGTGVLAAVFGLAGVALIVIAGTSSLGVLVVTFPVAMGLFGIGNGATFQIVGLRFSDRIGVVTGIVGAAGGLGGFMLPTLLGALHNAGGYGNGLAIVATATLCALPVIVFVRGRWRQGWAALAHARV